MAKFFTVRVPDYGNPSIVKTAPIEGHYLSIKKFNKDEFDIFIENYKAWQISLNFDFFFGPSYNLIQIKQDVFELEKYQKEALSSAMQERDNGLA